MTRKTPLSVRMTPDLAADLEVLQRGGLNASDAVREAVRQIAQAHRRIAELTEQNGEVPAALSIRSIHLTRPYDANASRPTGVVQSSAADPARPATNGPRSAPPAQRPQARRPLASPARKPHDGGVGGGGASR